MLEKLQSLGSLEYVLIAIIGVFLTAATLFLFLRETKSYIASDGVSFSSKEQCQSYEKTLAKVTSLYDAYNNNKSNEFIAMFDINFIKVLKEDGFRDVEKIMSYRREFQKFSDFLINDKVIE